VAISDGLTPVLAACHCNFILVNRVRSFVPEFTYQPSYAVTCDAIFTGMPVC